MTSAIKFKRILVVVAHTDDLEVNAGGSIARWIREGAEVWLLVLSDGRNGTANPDTDHTELIAKRQDDQTRAAGHLGIKPENITFADFIDGSIENTPAVRLPIVRMVREMKPDTVISWDPELTYDLQTGIWNHRDHRATGLAVGDAITLDARNAPTFPELLEENLEPHIVTTFLMMSGNGRPNYFVAITDEDFAAKRIAIKEHTTQGDLTQLAETRERAQAAGHHPEAAAVEAFVRFDILGEL